MRAFVSHTVFVVAFAALLALWNAGAVWGADFQKGLDAYLAGNYAVALQEWRPFAEQGDADAQTFLGFMYYEGRGVPQDYQEAVKWYRLAAEQGNASAQNNLGVMYSKGQVVPQDYIKAHAWLNLAASLGEESAAEARDILAKDMTSAQITEAQALARQCLAQEYKNC